MREPNSSENPNVDWDKRLAIALGLVDVGEEKKRMLQQMRAVTRSQQILERATKGMSEEEVRSVMVRLFGRLPGAIDPRWSTHNARNYSHLGLNRAERRKAKTSGKLGVTRAPCKRDARRVSRKIRLAHKKGKVLGHPNRNVPFEAPAPPQTAAQQRGYADARRSRRNR